MDINEIKQKVIDTVYSSGILKLQVSDINLVALSPDTYDVTVDDFPLGVRVKMNENDKSFALTFDSNRIKRYSNLRNPKDVVDDAIEEYMNEYKI